MLEIRDLRFAYKKNTVLSGVDFSAAAGECVCVLGENGAGKTTLFRCVLGLLGGYKGEILIDGKSGNRMSVREMAKKIAYIPQAHAPAFNFTVFEIVLMGTNVLVGSFRSPGKAERETAENMLDLLNIPHLSRRGYAELSGGERQLVLIARALAQKTKILVMDEPVANLDYGNQLRVMGQVSKLARSGYLVVLSTHNPEHAMLFADKALVLRGGVVAIYGNPESVLTPEMIGSVYGVTVELRRLATARGDVPVFVPCFE